MRFRSWRIKITLITNDSCRLYFRIANFGRVRQALRITDFAGIRSGARVDVDEYDKADARDFGDSCYGKPAKATSVLGARRLAMAALAGISEYYRHGDELSGLKHSTFTRAAST